MWVNGVLTLIVDTVRRNQNPKFPYDIRTANLVVIRLGGDYKIDRFEGVSPIWRGPRTQFRVPLWIEIGAAIRENI